MKDIILKTLITAQPHMAHIFKTSKPDDVENNLCFHILGMDIFLDKKCKPWLLEVNHTPSFSTETPLDYQIKKEVIEDTIKILNMNVKRKNKYVSQMRQEQQRRVYTGKSKLGTEEKEQL